MSGLDKPVNFQILDCTIRDGGYVNNWGFEKKLVREAYRALSKSGVDYIEIGYRGTEKYFDKDKYGIWRFSPEEQVREVIANINGAKLALMADFGKIDVDDFCPAEDSVIRMVRLATHKDSLDKAVKVLEQIKEKGYEVALNAMDYSGYSDKERQGLIRLLKNSPIDYIYVVDSYGSLFPFQIRSIIEPLLEIHGVKVGFHPHNSLQMAFANTLEAINCGAHIVDSTIYGMGRAAGNLPTEIIVSFLEKEKKAKYNSIPLLNIIDRYFSGLQKENSWGYQLPYMLSGMFQCHPNYAKVLVDSHEYTIEDMWKAMDYIKSRAPIGFSKEILDNLIADGIISGTANAPVKENSNSCLKAPLVKLKSRRVPYLDRYKGRDFLILANGPSLKDHQDKVHKFIAKFDPVILGANYLGGLFTPHYHAFTNKRRFSSYVDTVDARSKLFIGGSITEEMIREYTDRDYERIYYIDALHHDFGIDKGVVTTNCRTVAVLLLGIAIVMGARRIFAVGMDGYLQNKAGKVAHFYNEAYEKDDQKIILEMHQWCQRFLEQIDAYLISQGKEELHILTPTSYRAFYKGFENYI